MVHFVPLKFYESDPFVPVKSFFNQVGVILICQQKVLCETPLSSPPHLLLQTSEEVLTSPWDLRMGMWSRGEGSPVRDKQ